MDILSVSTTPFEPPSFLYLLLLYHITTFLMFLPSLSLYLRGPSYRPPLSAKSVKVMCISDTHNKIPDLNSFRKATCLYTTAAFHNKQHEALQASETSIVPQKVSHGFRHALCMNEDEDPKMGGTASLSIKVLSIAFIVELMSSPLISPHIEKFSGVRRRKTKDLRLVVDEREPPRRGSSPLVVCLT
jgi:hypothetical protein